MCDGMNRMRNEANQWRQYEEDLQKEGEGVNMQGEAVKAREGKEAKDREIQ